MVALVSLIVTTEPELYHPDEGDTVPPLDGLANVVRWYCVVYVAETVHVDVAENDPPCPLAPQPVNDENTY